MDQAERDHVLSTVKILSRRGVATTRDAIRDAEHLTKWQGDEPALDAALAALAADGSLSRSDDGYALTDAGRRLAQEVAARRFGAWMVACERSAAYRRMCELVYGADRCQFDMMSQAQLETLLGALRLADGQRVLDLGCGTGSLAEHIADRTGAIVTGVDFAPEAIAFAQARTAGKADRLSFGVMDMDELDLPLRAFDVVVSIDTLYFVEDLPRTVRAMRACLKDGGQMGIFYTSALPRDGSPGLPPPGETMLARALADCGLTFETCDFTEDEAALWDRQLRAARELEPAFTAEGNQAIYGGRITEASRMLERFRAGEANRYLYHVRL